MFSAFLLSIFQNVALEVNSQKKWIRSYKWLSFWKRLLI